MSDVYALLRDTGAPMTVREIAETQQRNPSVIRRNLNSLARYGLARKCGTTKDPDTGAQVNLWEAVR